MYISQVVIANLLGRDAVTCVAEQRESISIYMSLLVDLRLHTPTLTSHCAASQSFASVLRR